MFGGNDNENDVDNCLFDIVSDIANKCGFDLPYTKDQYDVELHQITDDVHALTTFSAELPFDADNLKNELWFFSTFPQLL